MKGVLANFLQKLVSILFISMVVISGITIVNIIIESKKDSCLNNLEMSKMYRYKVSNDSNSRLNLKSLIVDTVSRSNISDVTVLGMNENPALPTRLVATDQANYRFDLPEAELLSKRQVKL